MVSFIFTKEPSLSYLGYTKCKTLKVEKSFADRLLGEKNESKFYFLNF